MNTRQLPGQNGIDDSLTDDAGIFEKIDVLPDAPEWLDGNGRDFWSEYGGMLVSAGILRSGDKPALSAMCQAMSDLRRAEKLISEQGITINDNRGAVRSHPAMSTAKSARGDILAYSKVFGMTPLARKSLNLKFAGKIGDDGYDD